MKDVVWITHDENGNGGAATLGIEFNKILGVKTLFNAKETKVGQISTYKNIEDLKSLLYEIEPKIILFFLAPVKDFNDHKNFFDVIFEIQEKLKTKIIAVNCTRRGDFIIKNNTKVQEEFSKIFTGEFDYIWSLSEEGREYWEQYTKEYIIIDINLHTLTDKEINNRENTIGYIARFQSFKGVNRLIRSLEKTNSNVKYPYVYLGNDHDPKILENKGIVSGAIYVVNQFAKSIKDKTPKISYSMKSSASESVEKGKINIYPRYNFYEKEEVFKKVGIAICPTLARETKKEVKSQVSLFSNLSIEKDKDDKYIEKNKKYWPHAMEYVNYEFIDYGIPVMFSRDYCLTYDSTMIEAFPELIYDNLEDCFTYCQNNYENLLKIAPKQKEWLRNKLLKVNNKVKEELENILNK